MQLPRILYISDFLSPVGSREILEDRQLHQHTLRTEESLRSIRRRGIGKRAVLYKHWKGQYIGKDIFKLVLLIRSIDVWSCTIFSLSIHRYIDLTRLRPVTKCLSSQRVITGLSRLLLLDIDSEAQEKNHSVVLALSQKPRLACATILLRSQ